MLTAVRNAGADALPAPAALLAGVGRIGVPKGRWRYQNPGGEIARAIGADRAVALLASVDVLQQTLIGDACHAIGDAGYRILRSSIQDVRAEDRQQDDERDVTPSPKDELRHPRPTPGSTGADRSRPRHRYRDSIFAFLIAPTQSGS